MKNTRSYIQTPRSCIAHEMTCHCPSSLFGAIMSVGGVWGCSSACFLHNVNSCVLAHIHTVFTFFSFHMFIRTQHAHAHVRTPSCPPPSINEISHHNTLDHIDENLSGRMRLMPTLHKNSIPDHYLSQAHHFCA